jgi:hypothetical protein
VAGCCEYGDEPSGSGATELVGSVNVNRIFDWNNRDMLIGPLTKQLRLNRILWYIMCDNRIFNRCVNLYCNVLYSSIHDGSLLLTSIQLQLTSINSSLSTLRQYLSEQSSYGSSLLHVVFRTP